MGPTESGQSKDAQFMELQKSNREAFLLAEVKKETAKFEAAQKAINEIVRFFEYPYRGYTEDGIRKRVHEIITRYVRRLAELHDE